MKEPLHKLSDITLSRWVAYQNMYGQALDDRLREIHQMPKGDDKSNEMLLYDVDLHMQNYAFYTDTPLSEVKDLGISEVCRVMGAAFIAQKKEAIALNFRDVFSWNNEQWEIQPIYRATDKITKEQYDMVTDIALIWSDLQDGKHEALYELCGAYLRHPGEAYSSELLEVRKEVMKELPLSIALCVKMYNEHSIALLLKQQNG